MTVDLDRDAAAHNTPEARAAAVNSPAWSSALTLSSHPRLPGVLRDWLRVRDCLTVHGARDLAVTPASLVLWGRTGAGKTGLACCALRALAAAGWGSTFYWNLVTAPRPSAAASDEGRVRPSPCWFESWPRLLALHRRARWDEEAWFDLLEERVAALVLDDVGVDVGTPYRESFLLRHIEWASEVPRRVLVLTLNDPPSEWATVLGERNNDRLLDPSRFTAVSVDGPSLR